VLKQAFRTAAPLVVLASLLAVSPALASGDRHHHHGACRADHHRGHRGDGKRCGKHGQKAPGAHRHSCERGAYSAWDEEWLKTSIEGDLFEIDGGKIAQSKTTTSVVQALGAKLFHDHSESVEDARRAAASLGIEAPNHPTPSEEWELEDISTKSGQAFDQAYSSLEVKDHEQDIEETKSELELGCSPAIKKLAVEDLPMLEEHLKLSREALAKSKS
jgi:putative membrane protein